MPSTHEGVFTPVEMTKTDREKVHEQLERMLSTHHFRNSRRYPALLRFIVEETLDGRGEYLKERLLGVQVFDRPADYDTAADPIVRVTIAEIRKRIAQYYHDEEHNEELRIDLQPGHYAPEFRPAPGKRQSVISAIPGSQIGQDQSLILAHPSSATDPELAPSGPSTRDTPASRPWRRWTALVSAVFLLAGMSFFAWQNLRPSATEDLWRPMLTSRGPVLFCIPMVAGVNRFPVQADAAPGSGRTTSQPSSNGPSFRDYENLGQNVVYSDVLAAMSMANTLAAHHREYRVKLNVFTSLDDLRQGPTILIGALDNPWTLRALTNMPFTFAGDGDDRYWITDAKHPANRDWALDLKQELGSVTRDYAIVARLHNQQTAEPELIVAGIGMSGTAAAGEFLADPTAVQELRRRIGSAFKDRDFEVVLRTDLVNGVAGAPQIIGVAVL